MENFFNEGALKGKSGRSRVMAALKIISTGKKQFIYCLDQARVAGALLALFLIFTDFASNKAVTLLGFSLGTVIIMNCIRTLKKFYR